MIVKSTHPYCGLFIKALRTLNNKNSEFPPIQLPDLKVIGLSEPKRTQSLSQSSSADAHPPLPPSPLVLGVQPNSRVSDEQQRKEGDKNTNDCDLLLIVYHTVKRWTKDRTKSTANWIAFVWTRPASKKYKFYDSSHKWQWHNNLQRPVRGADKPALRGLIDTNYSFLKLSPHWSRDKCQQGRGTLPLIQ